MAGHKNGAQARKIGLPPGTRTLMRLQESCSQLGERDKAWITKVVDALHSPLSGKKRTNKQRQDVLRLLATKVSPILKDPTLSIEEIIAQMIERLTCKQFASISFVTRKSLSNAMRFCKTERIAFSCGCPESCSLHSVYKDPKTRTIKLMRQRMLECCNDCREFIHGNGI